MTEWKKDGKYGFAGRYIEVKSSKPENNWNIDVIGEFISQQMVDKEVLDTSIAKTLPNKLVNDAWNDLKDCLTLHSLYTEKSFIKRKIKLFVFKFRRYLVNRRYRKLI